MALFLILIFLGWFFIWVIRSPRCFCPACHSDVSASASVCAECHRDITPKPRFLSSVSKKAFRLLFAIIILMMLSEKGRSTLMGASVKGIANFINSAAGNRPN